MSPSDRPLAPRRPRGFSFVEILVVMGIIAVLVGIGIAVYGMVIKNTPKFKTKNLVQKVRNDVEAWKRLYKAYPPSDLNRVALVTNLPIKVVGRLNAINAGNESLYQCLFLPGVDFNPDLTAKEIGNLDDADRLDKPITKDQNPELYEILDDWGNPLVYFVDGEYEAAEKNPPTYQLAGNAPTETATPKPWRASTGGFAQPGSYQLFSMGPDQEPNTDDDIKAWEN